MNALRIVVLISFVGSLHLQKSNGFTVPTRDANLVANLHVVSRRKFVPSLPTMPQSSLPQSIISCAEIVRYNDASCTATDCYQTCDELGLASGLEDCTANGYYCCCDPQVVRQGSLQVLGDGPSPSSGSSMEEDTTTDDSYSTNGSNGSMNEGSSTDDNHSTNGSNGSMNDDSSTDETYHTETSDESMDTSTVTTSGDESTDDDQSMEESTDGNESSQTQN